MYFCCKICKIAVSKEINVLEDQSRLCFEAEKEFLPPGFFFPESEKIPKINFEHYGLSGDFNRYFLNEIDVINVKDHFDGTRLNGCCGMSGYFGINKVCRNNHEIGIEYSDCIMPHTVGLIVEKVELINNE